MRPVTRIEPVGPSRAYQTYQIVSPRPTHTKPATCEQVGCSRHANGFAVPVDEATELGQRQAHYIRKVSGRPFSEERVGQLTHFKFAPGVECFQSHVAPIDRPPLYVVREGDYRWRQGARRQFSGRRAAEDWQEHFADHQDKIATRVQRG